MEEGEEGYREERRVRAGERRRGRRMSRWRGGERMREECGKFDGKKGGGE